MADRAMDAVKTGELEIIPNTFVNTWNRWLGDIQDWCVSRQLWWGHRIPAYVVRIDGKETNGKCRLSHPRLLIVQVLTYCALFYVLRVFAFGCVVIAAFNQTVKTNIGWLPGQRKRP
jgi:hypothetical protein